MNQTCDLERKEAKAEASFLLAAPCSLNLLPSCESTGKSINFPCLSSLISKMKIMMELFLGVK